MIRKTAVALIVLAALISVPPKTTAQVTGVAFASFAGDVDVFAEGGPFIGPWRATATGIDIRYTVLCISAVDQSNKTVATAIATIPNGSSVTDIRSLSTTAIVTACANPPNNPHLAIAVNRGAVLLPAMNFGL